MKFIKSFISFALSACAAILMVACKPGVPDEYIQPGDMEDILYDYHIAMAMAEQGDQAQYSERVIAYKQAVFRKHDVTEKQFDTSLEYYTRHTERLHDIYDGLAERLNDEAKDLGANGETLTNDFKQNGDTTNVWHGAQALVMSPTPGYNTYSFSVKVDTAFHKGDHLSLEFNTNYIIQEGVRNAAVVLNVTLANDSIVSQTTRITSDSRNSAIFNDFGNIGIKSISGYFIYPPDNNLTPPTTLRILCITGIRMLRMHNKVPDSGSVQGGAMPGQPMPPGQPSSVQNPPAGAPQPPQQPSPATPQPKVNSPATIEPPSQRSPSQAAKPIQTIKAARLKERLQK